MAITTLNNRSINRSDTASADQVTIHGTMLQHEQAGHHPRGGYFIGTYSNEVASHGFQFFVDTGYLTDVDVTLYGIVRS